MLRERTKKEPRWSVTMLAARVVWKFSNSCWFILRNTSDEKYMCRYCRLSDCIIIRWDVRPKNWRFGVVVLWVSLYWPFNRSSNSRDDAATIIWDWKENFDFFCDPSFLVPVQGAVGNWKTIAGYGAFLFLRNFCAINLFKGFVGNCRSLMIKTKAYLFSIYYWFNPDLFKVYSRFIPALFKVYPRIIYGLFSIYSRFIYGLFSIYSRLIWFIL